MSAPARLCGRPGADLHASRVPAIQEAREQLLRLFQAAYPDPSAYDTYDDFLRAAHEDIAGLETEDVDRERLLARQRWALGDPSSWLAERLRRLDAEAEARRQPPRRVRR
jgi:hypothetical protein